MDLNLRVVNNRVGKFDWIGKFQTLCQEILRYLVAENNYRSRDLALKVSRTEEF